MTNLGRTGPKVGLECAQRRRHEAEILHSDHEHQMLPISRKTLRPVQTSIVEHRVQQKAKVNKSGQEEPDLKPDTIREDKSKVCDEKPSDDKECSKSRPQTDSTVVQKDRDESVSDDQTRNEDILDWLTKPQVSDSYWKELAEQRRLALAEALAENEELYETIESLRKENDTLKQVNESLQDMADEAHRLGSILKELTGDLDEEASD